MTGRRPEWWEPGISDRDIEIWEASERNVAAAPDLKRGDDAYMELRQLMGGCLAQSAPAREERGAA